MPPCPEGLIPQGASSQLLTPHTSAHLQARLPVSRQLLPTLTPHLQKPFQPLAFLPWPRPSHQTFAPPARRNPCTDGQLGRASRTARNVRHSTVQPGGWVPSVQRNLRVRHICLRCSRIISKRTSLPSTTRPAHSRNAPFFQTGRTLTTRMLMIPHNPRAAWEARTRCLMPALCSVRCDFAQRHQGLGGPFDGPPILFFATDLGGKQHGRRSSNDLRRQCEQWLEGLRKRSPTPLDQTMQ